MAALVSILLALSVPFVIQMKNMALEVGMNLWADRPSKTQFLFIDVDDETYRNEWWGGGEPRVNPRKPITELLEKLFEAGVPIVMLDFNFDTLTESSVSELEKTLHKQDEAFRDRVKVILQNHPDRRLLYVKSFQKPLQSNTFQVLRPSALDELATYFPEQVFPVAPNFVVSPQDRQIRYWRLWESACQVLDPKKDGKGRWVVVPSPQLVLYALSRSSNKPDLPPWGLATSKELITATCAVDNSLTAVREQGENSARADYQAGQWVWKTFGECYEQDLFSSDQCVNNTEFNKDTSPWAVDSYSRGENLGNRILYRYSYSDIIQRGDNIDKIVPTVIFEKALNFKDKNLTFEPMPFVAILGASYEDSRDWHHTPLGKMPGIMILANAIDTMQNTGLLVPPNPWVNAVFVVIMLVLVSFLFAALPQFWVSTLLLVTIAIALYSFSLWLVQEHGIWLDLTIPIMAIYLNMQIFRRRQGVHGVSS
ncbi:hypothetical protein THMIRHAT_22670 [Thiosulfativibrio zosterae]|uniref:CHASE2 domain-containing protein n=1 Tax=Thiosulfativibrio zosterae TaxID=2675053 RepID=A0A6F8PQX2_9GAMM|nr:hypothetical protein THMIRHAT_22670 [Thiosulfativibrio zosterae]